MRMIVDIAGLMHASMHGRKELKGPDGKKTNAVYGVLGALEKLVKQFEPEELVVVWDGGPAKRKELYPDYKSNRKREPEYVAEIRRQGDVLSRLLGCLPVVQIRKQDIEADDVIAVLTKFLHLENTLVITNDSDLYQLKTDKCGICDLKGGAFNLSSTPQRVLVEKILVGDTSDCIKGVPNFGPVSMRKVFDEHGSLKRILAAVKSGDLKLGRKGSTDYKDLIQIVKRNVRLIKLRDSEWVSEAERILILNQYRYGRLKTAVNHGDLTQQLEQLGFDSFLRRMKPFVRRFERLAKADAKETGEVDKKDQKPDRATGVAGPNKIEIILGKKDKTTTTKYVKKTRHQLRNRGGKQTAERATKYICKTKSMLVAAPSNGESTGRTVSANNGQAWRSRTRAFAQRISQTPEVRERQRIRKRQAMSVLQTFTTKEGRAWLKTEDTETIQFVSGVIASLEDQDFVVTKNVVSRLEDIKYDYLSEEPDWMKSGA